jgi:hypothetical protein
VGHLGHLLPDRAKVRRVEHHAAMPYAKLPTFVRELRAEDGTAARAVDFTILTAARAGEAMGADGPAGLGQARHAVLDT